MNWTKTATRLLTSTPLDARLKWEEILHPAPYGQPYGEPYGARSSSRPPDDGKSSPGAAR